MSNNVDVSWTPAGGGETIIAVGGLPGGPHVICRECGTLVPADDAWSVESATGTLWYCHNEPRTA